MKPHSGSTGGVLRKTWIGLAANPRCECVNYLQIVQVVVQVVAQVFVCTPDHHMGACYRYLSIGRPLTFHNVVGTLQFSL